MKLEKIMKRENLLKAGFKEIKDCNEKKLMWRCKTYSIIVYFQLKDNLYQRARKLG